MVVVWREQRHKDRRAPNCTINRIAVNSGTLLFFRVAAAVVFDVSRSQTFHSVLKVGTEIKVLMLFDCNRLFACDDPFFQQTRSKQTCFSILVTDCLCLFCNVM